MSAAGGLIDGESFAPRRPQHTRVDHARTSATRHKRARETLAVASTAHSRRFAARGYPEVALPYLEDNSAVVVEGWLCRSPGVAAPDHLPSRSRFEEGR